MKKKTKLNLYFADTQATRDVVQRKFIFIIIANAICAETVEQTPHVITSTSHRD